MQATNPIKFYAFLDRIDTTSKGQSRSPERLRTNFIFDTIPADSFDNGILDGQEAMPLIRVMTTKRMFTEMVANKTSTWEPKEGDWYLIEIQSQEGGPRVWQAKTNHASGEFEEQVGSTRLTEISLLPDGTLKGKSSNARFMKIGKKLRKSYVVHGTKLDTNQNMPQSIKVLSKRRLSAIKALDVGQASMVALFQGNEVVAFYDVGWPLPFNKSSPPSPPDIDSFTLSEDCVVILSHWDYDHYSRARIDERLRNLMWVAPEGIVGPNTHKFIKSLGRNLYVASPKRGFPLNLGCFCFEWANGTDRNNSGLVVHLVIGKSKILLTGDASYDHIAAHLKTDLTALTIPHHASETGHFIASIPPPLKSTEGKAVICAGHNNRYGHPSSTVLTDHETKKWNVEITGDNGTGKRGSRFLYP